MSPAQQELARKAVILRARLPAWLEGRRLLVREGLSCCLPSALEAVVQGTASRVTRTCGMRLRVFLLGLFRGEYIDLGTECGRIKEEDARLRDRNDQLKRGGYRT